MEQIRFCHTKEYSVRECLLSLVRLILSVEFLLFSFFHVAKTLFSEWVLPTEVILQLHFWIYVSCLVFEVFCYFLPSHRTLVRVFLAAMVWMWMGYTIYKNADRLWSGLVLKLNPYLEAWNKYYFTHYNPYEGELGEQIEACIWVVLVLWMSVLFLYFITRVRLFLLLPFLTVLVLGLLVSHKPDWTGLSACFVGVLVLYSGGRERPDFVSKQRRRGTSEYLRPFLSLFAVALFGIVLMKGTELLFLSKAEQIPQKSPFFVEFQRNVEKKVTNMARSTGINYSKSAYVNNRTPSYTGEEILTITADYLPESNLYLCNFTSGEYRNGRWVQDSLTFEGANETTRNDIWNYFFTKQNTNHPFGHNVSYTIDYKTKLGIHGLVPYFTDLSSASQELWVDKTGLVKKDWLTKSVTLTGCSKNVNLYLAPLLTDDYFYLLSSGYYPGSAEKTDENDELIERHKEFVEETYVRQEHSQMVKYYAEEIGSFWVNCRGTIVTIFPKGAMNVPPEFAESSEYLYQVRIESARQVQEYLARHASYNLYLKSLPANMDAVDYFLGTTREGYCMHFASAGVMLLQERMIPARYASGYIVKRGSFTEQEDGTYKAIVTDRAAHAWAEVYIDGVGWVPYEMTPGYSGDGKSLPTDEQNMRVLEKQTMSASEPVDLESQESESEETESQESESEETELENSQTQDNVDEESGGTKDGAGVKGSQNKWFPIFVKIGKILLLCLLVLTGLYLLIWQSLKKYRGLLVKELREKQYRLAVKRINRRIRRYMLMRKGVLGYRTNAEYMECLIKSFPTISAKDWSKFMEITGKVAYSLEAVSKEEMEFCYRIYRMYRKQK